MWTTLALGLALLPVPAANGPLSIANDRLTYGHLGPDRKDADLLPGDLFTMTFEVRNMTFDAKGNASYSIGMEVLDGAGQVRFRQAPRNLIARNYLGGKSLFSVATIEVPPQAKPGDYTVKVTVEDRATKAKASLERKGRVREADFGLIRVGTSADGEGLVHHSAVATLGDSLYVNFSVIGFARDKATKQPNVEMALRILDDKGKPTVGQPIGGKTEGEIPEKLLAVPMQFGLTLNRAGRYTVEVSANDRVSGKSARVSFPIRVLGRD